MFDLMPFSRKDTRLQSRKYAEFDLENMFENFFNDKLFPSLYANSGQMRVNIKENEKEFFVEAEIPGFNKEEINIEIEDDRLTITAETNEKTEEKSDRYIRRERKYNSLTRSFALSDIVKENITAKFENGILFLTLPKEEKARGNIKKINIQ